MHPALILVGEHPHEADAFAPGLQLGHRFAHGLGAGAHRDDDAFRLGMPVVIEDVCVGCGLCQHLCPRGVLRLENRKKGDRLLI